MQVQLRSKVGEATTEKRTTLSEWHHDLTVPQEYYAMLFNFYVKYVAKGVVPSGQAFRVTALWS